MSGFGWDSKLLGNDGMKKVLVTLFVLAMFVATASAQVPAKPFNIYVGGGLTMPTGDFKTAYNTGFHGMAKVGFSAMPKMEIRFGVDYHLCKANDEFLAYAESYFVINNAEGMTAQIMMFGADLKLNLGVPGAPIKPYGIAGLGIASIGYSDLEADEGVLPADSESKFYLEFGGGIEFTKFFVQGKITVIPGYYEALGEKSALGFLAITGGLHF